MPPIASSAPDQATGASRASVGPQPALGHRDRPAPAGHARRARRHPRRLPHPVGREAHPPGEHGHPRGPGDRRGDHGDGHGAHHRVPEHRPVGRVAGRRHRDGLRGADDRHAAQRPRDRRGRPVQWIVALALGVALGAFIGAFQGFIIAYIGVPPSSSPWAACWRCAGPSGCCRGSRGHRHRRTFRQVGGGVSGRSAER